MITHEANGHVLVEGSSSHAAETAGAARIADDRLNQTARVLSIAFRVLAERAYPWVTLVLAAVLWFCVTLLVELTPLRIAAAVFFTILTHVPTWACWRRGGS